MARVQLAITDPAQSMTLRAMLEAAGHKVDTGEPEALFCDSPNEGLKHCQRLPVILTATASQVPDAARAVRKGVWGYVFVPFQPGEAELALERALASPGAASTNDGAPEDMKTLEQVEWDYISKVLLKCKHNQARAARVLGIGRNTLWRKLKRSRADLP